MAGGKLARLLQAVGGASRNETRALSGAARGPSSNTAPSKPGVSKLTSTPGRQCVRALGVPDPAPAQARKRRRKRGAKPNPAASKRVRREAGPATKSAAGSFRNAAAMAAAEDADKELEEERQKLLGGRSAYEALMDELARGVPRGDRRGGGKAELRALLQRLRTEQLGEGSDDEEEDDDEGEDEDEDEGEDGEGELGSSEEGAEDDDEGTEAETELRKGRGAKGAGGSGQRRQGAAQANGAHSSDGEDDSEDEEDGDADIEGSGEGEQGQDGQAIANGGPGGRRRGAGRRKAGDDQDSGSGDGGTGSGPGDESSEEGDEAGVAAAANGRAPPGQDPSAQEAAAAAAAVVDTWVRHVGRELSEIEVAALGSGRSSYVDAPPAEVHSSAWGPHARWQVRLYGAAAAAAAAGGSKPAAAAGAAAPASAVGLTALPAAPPSLPEYGVKERLVSRWREVRQDDELSQPKQDVAAAPGAVAANGGGAAAAGPNRAGRASTDFSCPQQRSLFALLNSYADIQLPCRPYPTDASATDPLLDAVLLHCLNHVAKSADRIKKNNHALEQHQQHQKQGLGQEHGEEAGKEAAGGGGGGGTPRDQGFTRAKVLLLLPQRNLAFRAVRRLVALAIRETRSDSVQGKEKFVEQFTEEDDGDDPENMDAAARARWAARPAEHRALFAGNLDDHFRLGIKVTKGAIRLFADLYQSDIIVASPVALATKLAEDKRADPHAAPDFLSSVEVLVVDRADMMGMQNWAHVETVVAALNHLPREQHGTDIMRVRDWYLSGQAGLYRQTVLLSSYNTPYTNALSRAATNCEGAVRLAVEQPGVLGAVVPQVRQLFERFNADSPASVGDARFEFFMRAVWPRVKDSVSRGLLLFVPSYFDFVRLRNALKAEDSVDFAAVSEYSSSAEVTRSRARFYHGQRRMLLYTERAHFYHRYRIRGIKDILFYGLPEHGHYYPELLNLLEEGGTLSGGAAAAAAAGAKAAASGGGSNHHHATVTALFCSWDVLALERVVGSSRARKMLRGESGTYMFC